MDHHPASTAPDFLHDAIMDAVVFAAERFLGGGDWQANLDLVLSRLGEAAGVSRAYMFKRSDGADGHVVSRRKEWVGAGVEPQIDNPSLAELSLRAAGLAAWEDGLARGEIMQAHVDQVPIQAQRLMAPQGIHSVVHVPIHIDGEWWGFLGFDECRAKRVWAASELSALRAAAQLLGAAIGRRRLERSVDFQRRQTRLQADIGALVTEGQLGDGAFARRCVQLLVERLDLDFAGIWKLAEQGETSLLACYPPDARQAEDGPDIDDDPLGATFPLAVGDDALGVMAVADGEPIPAEARAALWSVCDEIALALSQEASVERLRAQEERFRALVETAPDGILVLDEEGRIVSANAALPALLGGRGSDLIGRPFSSFLPAREGKEFDDALRAHVAAGSADPDRLSGEWEWQAGEDETLPVEALFGQYEDHGRRFFTAFLRDITERREAEENARTLIREQAARAEAETAHRRSEFLSEASRTLAMSFDYATTLASVVQLAVPELADYAWVDLMEDGGLLRRVGVAHVDPELEPVIHRALRQLDAFDGPEGHMLARLFQDAAPLVFPEVDLAATIGLSPDAEYADALRTLAPRSVLAVPVVVRDRTLAAFVLALSSSERRYAREDLALARDLAARASLAVENAQLYWQALEAKKARDDILGVVAHDLRNPLNTIGMAAQTVEELDDERAQKMGRTIGRSVSLMNRLIGDLLQTRELEAGALRLELRRHKAWAIAEEALATLQPLAAAKGQELIASGAELDCEVEVDPLRILQVISNLVGNAVKFTPEGGRIELTCGEDPDGVRFCVRDTGPGIPSEQIPHVFGRFWRARAADGQGLGLGLSIAEGIVTAHGGRIWVESEPGHGAAFHFTLPPLPAEAPATAPDPSPLSVS